MSDMQPVRESDDAGATPGARRATRPPETKQVQVNVTVDANGGLDWDVSPDPARTYLEDKEKTLVWRLSGKDANGPIGANRLFFCSPEDPCSDPPPGPWGADGIRFDDVDKAKNPWITDPEKAAIDGRLHEEEYRCRPDGPVGGLRAYKWTMNPTKLVGKDKLGEGTKLKLKYEVRIVLDGRCHVLDPEEDVQDPPPG